MSKPLEAEIVVLVAIIKPAFQVKIVYDNFFSFTEIYNNLT